MHLSIWYFDESLFNLVYTATEQGFARSSTL